MAVAYALAEIDPPKPYDRLPLGGAANKKWSAAEARELLGAICRQVLERDTDALIEASFADGLTSGALSVRDVVYSLAMSDLYRDKYGSPGNPLPAVQQLYRRLLAREGEPAGVAFWLGEVPRHGLAAAIRGFVTSPEYQNRFGLDRVPSAQLKEPNFAGLVHLADLGDRPFGDGEWGGTKGQSRRLEGFQISITPKVDGLSVHYLAHLQNIGDVPWVNEGAFVGTRGQSRRLEGFAVQLTGPRAAEYDVLYQGHLEGFGDTRVFKNGEFCGTRGQSRRCEAIRVWLEHKATVAVNLPPPPPPAPAPALVVVSAPQPPRKKWEAHAALRVLQETYRAVLERDLDDAGRTAFASKLVAGEIAVRDVVLSLGLSDEYAKRFGDKAKGAETVGPLYRHFLGRQGEPGGMAYWGGVLPAQGIGHCVRGFVGSAEYLSHFGDDEPPCQAWDSLGGVITTPPSAVSIGKGKLAVFARGTDNALWWRLHDNGGWHDWHSLGGVITTRPNAVSWSEGRIDVFARGTDNALWHLWFDGAWHPWESLGGVLTSAPFPVSQGPGKLDVLVAGTDRSNWLRQWDGKSWHPWYQPTTYDRMNAAPAVCSWGPGRIDLFHRGAGDALYHKAFEGGAWQPWESLGGVCTSSPSACASEPGRIDVFVRGTDNALWRRTLESGHWSEWASHGGVITSAPAATSAGKGKVDVLARGTDQAVWRMSLHGGKWKPWATIGGPGEFWHTLPTDALDQELSVVAEKEDLVVFQAGPGRALWTARINLELDAEAPPPHEVAPPAPHPVVMHPPMVVSPPPPPPALAPSRWTSLGGVCTSLPAACSPDGKRLEVFVRGTDNALWRRTNDGSKWLDWRSEGGVITTAPAAVASGGGKFDVFARGTDNALWHKAGAGGVLHDWQSHGGIITATPCATSWGPNRVDVWCKGSDNSFWQMWSDGTWHPWQGLGGVLASEPAAACWSAGRVDAFCRGTDGALWQAWWNGQWHWNSLGGVLTSMPSVCSWEANRLDVFARGTDHAIWLDSWDGKAWSGWHSLGGFFASAPYAVAAAKGAIDVFARRDDGTLHVAKFRGGKWSAFAPLGGPPGAEKLPASDPMARQDLSAVAGKDHVDLFVTGGDRALWHYRSPL